MESAREEIDCILWHWYAWLEYLCQVFGDIAVLVRGASCQAIKYWIKLVRYCYRHIIQGLGDIFCYCLDIHLSIVTTHLLEKPTWFVLALR